MQFGDRISSASRRRSPHADRQGRGDDLPGPTTSLNPCFTIGFQLTETLRLHSAWITGRARPATELLEQVAYRLREPC